MAEEAISDDFSACFIKACSCRSEIASLHLPEGEADILYVRTPDNPFRVNGSSYCPLRNAFIKSLPVLVSAVVAKSLPSPRDQKMKVDRLWGWNIWKKQHNITYLCIRIFLNLRLELERLWNERLGIARASAKYRKHYCSCERNLFAVRWFPPASQAGHASRSAPMLLLTKE
jgi:hypothetical protein